MGIFSSIKKAAKKVGKAAKKVGKAVKTVTKPITKSVAFKVADKYLGGTLSGGVALASGNISKALESSTGLKTSDITKAIGIGRSTSRSVSSAAKTAAAAVSSPVQSALDAYQADALKNSAASYLAASNGSILTDAQNSLNGALGGLTAGGGDGLLSGSVNVGGTKIPMVIIAGAALYFILRR